MLKTTVERLEGSNVKLTVTVPSEDVDKVIEAREVAAKTGYAAPHTVHCGPDGVYINALGAVDGDGPGGIFMLDHETFDVRGPRSCSHRPRTIVF